MVVSRSSSLLVALSLLLGLSLSPGVPPATAVAPTTVLGTSSASGADAAPKVAGKRKWKAPSGPYFNDPHRMAGLFKLEL